MHDPLHQGIGLNAGGIDVTGIAHQTQNGQISAHYRADGDALVLQPLANLVDLLLGNSFFEHNNHEIAPLPSGSDGSSPDKKAGALFRVPAALSAYPHLQWIDPAACTPKKPKPIKKLR